MSKHRRDIAALVALSLLVLAFFWPVLSGRYHLPRGGGDLVSFLWPTWRFAARSLHEGTLPLWNPTLYAGMPFAADNQSSLFYPINLLLFLLQGEPGYRTMEALVILHMGLAAALMYLLLRSKRLGGAASVFGGLAFGLSDLFVTHIGNLNLNATIAYLPGLILLADRAFTRRSAGWAAGAGALLAVSALAGHGQMLLFMGMALVVLALYRALGALRRGPWGALQVLALAALVAAVGIAGAAVALYPAYELTGQSMRAGGLSLEEASRYSLPWRALVGLLVAGFYGRGVQSFWGSWDRVEMGYVGVLPLVLGLAALLPRGKEERGERSFPVGFFAALALVGVAMAVGSHAPIYRLAHALPLLSSLRAPARAIVLTSFGLAALGAYGLDRLPRSRRLQNAALAGLAFGLALALALPQLLDVPAQNAGTAQQASRIAAGVCAAGLAWLGALRWQRGTRGLAAAGVLILAADLIVCGSTVEVDPGNPQQGYEQDQVVAWLRSDPGPYRIDSSAASAWQPDTAAVYGLYDISGVANPLGLARYEMYRWSTGGRGSTLYSLLGVRYVLASKGESPGDERLVPVYTAAPDVDVYLNTTACPMAQLVYGAQQAGSVSEAFEAIHKSAFDPAQAVILEEAPQPVVPPGDQPHGVEWLEYSENRLALQVNTPTPAYLLLSEVYYPGWQAAIDGEPARVLPADYLFRAVYVPAGTHEVTLRFSPPSFWVSLGASLAVWLGLGAWGLVALLRRRAQH